MGNSSPMTVEENDREERSIPVYSCLPRVASQRTAPRTKTNLPSARSLHRSTFDAANSHGTAYIRARHFYLSSRFSSDRERVVFLSLHEFVARLDVFFPRNATIAVYRLTVVAAASHSDVDLGVSCDAVCTARRQTHGCLLGTRAARERVERERSTTVGRVQTRDSITAD